MRASLALPVTLGILAGLSALLQLGPVYWPGGGYLLAMAAVLPVALAAALTPRRCTWFFLATALLIGMGAVEEMFVFITTTGPLGLMLGLTLDRRAWQSWLAAGAMLAGGMALMPYLAGVFAWGGVERTWPAPVLLVAYCAFAVPYAALWCWVFRRIWPRVAPGLRYTRGDDTQRSCRP